MAASTGTFYGQATTAGDIYTVAGDGNRGYSGDGVPATAASLNGPHGVTADASGNLVIADQYNSRVRVVAATRAAVGPESITFDAAGNLVLADTFNNRVRVVAVRDGTFFGQKMIAGDIYTVAGNGTSGFAGDGGPPRSAELGRPAGELLTPAGNLLIADQNNHRVRIVTS
ncbi:MAG TPA: hypothetical protein VMU94_03450 [Streptosporangiaceae bacterium]|nr:hypothetical protein [Streptosporangiaceae bacterium]